MTEGTSSIRIPLTPKAAGALKSAAVREGLGNADTMNRAIQLYDVLSEAQAAGRSIFVEQPEGGMRELLWDRPT